jgi:hypothetical protein
MARRTSVRAGTRALAPRGPARDPSRAVTRDRPHPRPGTVAVHAGEPRPQPGDAVVTPIACTSTYTFRDTAELRDHFEGRSERDEYGRYGNPTVAVAERKLAALEAAGACALFASGMAAITTTLLTLVRPGQHVVLTADGYRRTRQFITGFLAKFNVAHTIVDPGDLAGIAAAITPNTRVLLTESPTNPYLRVIDLPALAAIKRAHRGLKLLIDAPSPRRSTSSRSSRAPTSSSTPAPSTSAATTTCSPAPSAATTPSSAPSASCAACSAASSTPTPPTS